MSVSGFALRFNGSCPSALVDCGQTVAPFHACCPGSTFCPTAYNVDCCPTTKNCTAELVEKPKCANPTWDLYDNGGYFCCEGGFVGYANPGNSDGCAAPGYVFQDGERLLPKLDFPPEESSTTSSKETPTQTSAIPTDSGFNQTSGSKLSDEDESSNGPLIGGVVAGGVVAVLIVVGLVIFWRRRRRREADARVRQEMDGTVLVAEMSGADASAAGSSSQGTPAVQKRSLAEMDGRSRPAQLAEQNEYSELAA